MSCHWPLDKYKPCLVPINMPLKGPKNIHKCSASFYGCCPALDLLPKRYLLHFDFAWPISNLCVIQDLRKESWIRLWELQNLSFCSNFVLNWKKSYLIRKKIFEMLSEREEWSYMSLFYGFELGYIFYYKVFAMLVGLHLYKQVGLYF